MAWKPLKQTSLADALLIEHSALTELDGILKGRWLERGGRQPHDARVPHHARAFAGRGAKN